MIAYVGIDAHTTNYTLSTYLEGSAAPVNTNAYSPSVSNIVNYCKGIRKKIGNDTEIIVGYEAGCLGFKLKRDLEEKGLTVKILAPASITGTEINRRRRKKTDKRDAYLVAKCLANGGYHAVYVPSKEDAAVKEYIRMRDDHKDAFTKIKQQIGHFCMHNGFNYSERNWTQKHLIWLRKVEMSPMLRETLNEYLITYDELDAKIERLDTRIDELARETPYWERVSRLGCFLGIRTHTALSLIVETGDFERFAKGNTYAAYLGLAPGENSSGTSIRRGGITKAGNSHLRKILIEAAQGICKGTVGYKSKEMRKRQNGNSPEVIAYADKANIRLRRKYYKYIQRGKKRNVAVTAIARELACFVWGMMTDNIITYSPG